MILLLTDADNGEAVAVNSAHVRKVFPARLSDGTLISMGDTPTFRVKETFEKIAAALGAHEP